MSLFPTPEKNRIWIETPKTKESLGSVDIRVLMSKD